MYFAHYLALSYHCFSNANTNHQGWKRKSYFPSTRKTSAHVKKTDRPLTQFLLQNSLYATSFTQNVKNHFDCIVDNNYSAYCLCSGYPIWPIFQTCSRQPDSSLVPESIRQCQKFNVNLRKCRWDSSSNNLVVSI